GDGVASHRTCPECEDRRVTWQRSQVRVLLRPPRRGRRRVSDRERRRSAPSGSADGCPQGPVAGSSPFERAPWFWGLISERSVQGQFFRVDDCTEKCVLLPISGGSSTDAIEH